MDYSLTILMRVHLILSKLHKPLGKCNVKEFSNITGSVNLILIARAFTRYAPRCKLEIYDKLACSQLNYNDVIFMVI